MTAPTPIPPAPASRFASAIDRFAAWLARHWLAVFNALVGAFLLTPFLAPILREAGATGVANVIYTAYAPTCHQLPERSFFLFGHQHVYTVEELETAGELPVGLGIPQRQMLRWQGSIQAGFKIALCQRDLAIYGSILISGLLFGMLRGRLRNSSGKLPRLPLRLYGLLLLPIVLDGFTQLFGLRESHWVLRLLTGALFGAATVWLVYPYVDEAMADVSQTALNNMSLETGQKAPPAV